MEAYIRYLFPLLAAALAGCTATGPAFNEAALPKGGSAMLVVYRPDDFGIGTIGFEVSVNGQKACSLQDQGFFVKEVSGSVLLSSSLWHSPGTSKINLDTTASNVYYVRLQMDQSKQVAGAIGGFAGQLIAEGASDTGGPFLFTLVTPEQAQKELRGLKQDCI